MDDGQHLHREDHPETLCGVSALVGHHDDERLGYTPTEHGPWVWDRTIAPPASCTKTAVVAVMAGS